MEQDLNQPGSGEPVAEASPPARRARRHFPAGVVCGAGCGRTQGYRCGYEDMSGRRCAYWCEHHSVLAAGRSWCQRHANSVRWLHARDGSIYEIRHQAAIDDRSPNLVGSLVDELNRPMTAGLMAVYARHDGVQIVTDGHVRTARNGVSETGHTAWERGWGVVSSTGYIARVALRAVPAEPPEVQVYANGKRVLSRVPDFIANRGTASDVEADRVKFRRDILAAVGPALPANPEYDPDALAEEP